MTEEAKIFDVVILGSGPGGYPAAIKAAQNGLSVALIEGKELGGTCLNRGCIPSKALIAGAELFERMKDASEFGISFDNLTFDYSKMIKRKDATINKIRKGLQGLISANGITLIKGYGKFISPTEIEVTGEFNGVVKGNKFIIATGSEPRNISAFPFDYKKIHDSTSLLDLQTLPKKIIIVGGGVIGCEFASLMAILGVEVVILEMLPRIIPMEDKGLSLALTKIFQKKGIIIETGIKVDAVETDSKGVKAILSDGRTFDADIALISVGRAMNTKEIGLEKAGVIVNENGLIPVSDKMETNVSGIYAIGDIASKWWLAHVATHQGIVAADNAAGREAIMHYEAIPNVIYTHPEIATVGLTLEDALEKGYDAIPGNFPFQALGKSQAAHQTEGFAQVIIDRKTNQILGAQVMGHEASSLIAEMTLALANELTLECIMDTIHAHPTISEAWMQAAFIANGTPIDFPPQKSVKPKQ